jgi:hypothetical protein
MRKCPCLSCIKRIQNLEPQRTPHIFKECASCGKPRIAIFCGNAKSGRGDWITFLVFLIRGDGILVQETDAFGGEQWVGFRNWRETEGREALDGRPGRQVYDPSPNSPAFCLPPAAAAAAITRIIKQTQLLITLPIRCAGQFAGNDPRLCTLKFWDPPDGAVKTTFVSTQKVAASSKLKCRRRSRFVAVGWLL